MEKIVEVLREKQADREEAVEEGKKKKGGVHVPEEWPWQAAKDLFLKPDVTPADSFDVSPPKRQSTTSDKLIQICSWNGKLLTLRVSSISLFGIKVSSKEVYSSLSIGYSRRSYSEERVRRGAEKLTKHIGAKQQGRLDGFFTAVPKASQDKGGKKAESSKGKATKRKVLYLRVFILFNSITDILQGDDEGKGPSKKVKRK